MSLESAYSYKNNNYNNCYCGVFVDDATNNGHNSGGFPPERNARRGGSKCACVRVTTEAAEVENIIVKNK